MSAHAWLYHLRRNGHAGVGDDGNDNDDDTDDNDVSTRVPHDIMM